MDFSKIRPAVEEITLTDEQMEQIISNCKRKKKKFNYKPLIAAAAAAVIIVVIASPGFLFRAKEADNAVSENTNQTPAENYGFLADEDIYYHSENSGAGDMPAQDVCIFADFSAFEADEFSELYCLIPSEFLHFAGDDLNSWLSSVSPDNGMAIMQFVMHFSIPKDDFISANLAFSSRTGKCFDTDAIYTFDKELIDGIYRK